MINPNKILVVCSGNTCRSPMGKIILEKMLQDHGLDTTYNVDSAACVKTSDTKAHPNSQKVIEELYGVDLLASHVPKKLTKEMIDEAKVIIVMEEYMVGSLPADKVIVLGIPDIWNSNIAAYRTCAGEMQQGFQKYWPKIVNQSPQIPKATMPSKTKIEEQLEHFNKLIKNYGPDPWSSAQKVYEEVLTIAKSVNYGRGTHSQTVTRLMLNMYDDLVVVDLIKPANNKRVLAEIIGLSHDIGVGKEKTNEEHNEAGWRMLKEQLWEGHTLGDNEKNPLALIMYGVFYHRDEVINGKLKPLGDIPLWDSRAAAEFVSLVRIADGLDYGYSTGGPDKIEKVEMVRTPKGVECRVFPRHRQNVISLIAKSYKKDEVFEATFGKLTYWLPGEGGSWNPWKPGTP